MKIFLIEDEPVALRRLTKLLQALKPDWSVIGSADSVEDSINFLDKHTPDLIITDIQLADGLSFDIFEEVMFNGPIIFTTAYDNYAIKAFKLNSIDYILKPILKESLLFALNKYENLEHKFNHANALKPLFSESAERNQKRILTKIGSQIKIIETDQVAIFFTENKVNYALDFDGTKTPVDESLEEIMSMLNEERFFRINRQVIVHAKIVEKLAVISSSRIKLIPKMKIDFELEVSKEKTPIFKTWFLKAQ